VEVESELAEAEPEPTEEGQSTPETEKAGATEKSGDLSSL